MTKRWVRLMMVGAVVVGASAGVWGEEAGTRPGGKLPPLPFTVSKETTGIVSPLREDGTPDYVGALNERYGKGVKPRENGFVDYLRIMGPENVLANVRTRASMLQICGFEQDFRVREVWKRERTFSSGADVSGPERAALLRAMRTPWKAEDNSVVDSYLQGRDKLLDQALVAAREPKWWIPIVASDRPEMLNITLPALAPVRDLAEGLCARAMRRARAGDFEGFEADVIGAKRLGRQVGSGATLIECLIGFAVDAQVNITISSAVGRGIWSQQQCQHLRKALADLPEQGSPGEALRHGERSVMLDAIVYMSMQKSGKMGSGKPPRFDIIDQGQMRYDIVLKMANKQYDGLVEALKQPRAVQAQEEVHQFNEMIGEWRMESEKNEDYFLKKGGEDAATYSERVGKGIIACFAPNLGKTVEFYRKNLEEQVLLDVLLAAGEYRGQTGHWPKELSELTPGHLKEVPMDSFSSTRSDAVRFAVTEHGVIVYSVGMNGMDDEGRDDRAKGWDDIVLGAREETK